MFSLNARIPEALATKVKLRAVREKKTVQQLVAEALGDYLKKPITKSQEDE
jgi:predicted HicB family RNase H-like nuclease